MQRGHRRARVFLSTCLIVAAGVAGADTVTFDAVGMEAGAFARRIPGVYRGLRWKEIVVVNANHRLLDRYPACGYRTGLVSGSYVAVTASRDGQVAEIVSAEGTTFDFHGVHLTAAWKNGLTVHLEGLRNGKLLQSTSVVVDTAQPTPFTTHFRGLDTLRIRSSGGSDAGICDSGCRPGPEVVLDDFSFVLSTQPEPPVAPPTEEPPPLPLPPPAEAVAPEPPQVDEPTPAPVREPAPTEVATGGCRGSSYGVQVGAFRSRENASRLRDKVAAYGPVRVDEVREGAARLYKVVVGCAADRDAAEALLRKLLDGGIAGYVVSAAKP
jgi:hypothetical protein